MLLAAGAVEDDVEDRGMPCSGQPVEDAKRR
jgi:hypothetical protein